MATPKDNNQEVSIENTILSNMGIADIDTGDDDDDAPESAERTEADDELEAKASLPIEEEDPAFKDLKLKTGDRETKAKPQKADEQKPIAKGTGYAQDGKGNIVDKATGKVIAPSGVAARLFREREHERTAHRSTQLQLQTVGDNLRRAIEIGREFNTQIKAYKEANIAYNQMGLQPQEVIEAAGFMSRLKKGGQEGITALKEILTRAATIGIDTSALGVAGGGLDPKAIVDAIKAELSPVTTELKNRSQQDRDQEERTAQEREAWNGAARQALQFFEENPEAQEYAPQIEKLLKDERMKGFSLREIWAEIRLYKAQNGNRKPAPKAIPSARRGPPNGMGKDWMNKPAPAGTSQKDVINQLLDAFADELGT